MSLPTEVLDALTAAHTGDADAAERAFAEDATFVGNLGEPELRGADEIVAYFLAFGGRRELFQVRETFGHGDVQAVRWTFAFQADSAGYAHEGWARVTLDGDRITRWEGLWTEREVAVSELWPD